MELNQGDIIKTNFSPQSGHEQAGYRPAVLISNASFNRHSNLVLACPITHTDRKNPFHVALKENCDIDGFILCDQIKSLDLKARGYRYVSSLDRETLCDVLDIIYDLLEKEEQEI